jgi:hypothetical protein
MASCQPALAEQIDVRPPLAAQLHHQLACTSSSRAAARRLGANCWAQDMLKGPVSSHGHVSVVDGRHRASSRFCPAAAVPGSCSALHNSVVACQAQPALCCPRAQQFVSRRPIASLLQAACRS